MSLRTKDYFDSNELEGMNDVLESLELIMHDLPLSKLQRLRNFNTTYLIITRNVQQASRKGIFRDRKFMEKFDGRFAYYYTHALQQYLKKAVVAPAWHMAFEQARRQRGSPFITMALGVNAHVNNDIPLVLLDCGAKDFHRYDFDKVNEIIEFSIDEVIGELDNTQRMIDPKSSVLRPSYELAMRKLITRWRGNAWNKFEYLKTGRASVVDIEQGALKLAKQIMILPV